jgi:glycine/D-amino acid oxidase-like deaminating enzyme
MTNSPPHFVIVGGGTAGWIAALMLQDSAKRASMPMKITVIESSKIPVIGVGEGTTAVFRILLKHFGFDEFEFIRETGATIKFGIRHRDWRRVGHSYDGPIDDPASVVARPQGASSSFLDIYSVAAGRSVTEPHLFAYLLDGHKSPYALKADGGLIAAGPFHYAYHFDQALVGKYLRKKSSGINMLDAQVVGARRDADTGDITGLVLDEGAELEGNFFIDCTGFRKRLIVNEMGAKWISYAKELPVNRAMPFWLDLKEGEEIAPYTLAWAQKAGWLWSIPTQQRYGMGYVYSDNFLQPDDAQREIETALGHPIQPRNDIRFEIGRLDNSWIGNCLALGLSSSFLEPLEATSIHGTIVQMMIFSQFHLKHPAKMTDADRAAYNDAAARQLDDFRRFINLHYVSERRDTPFWRHVADTCILPETHARLAQWSKKMPRSEDFVRLPGSFPHVEEQLHYPVLDGLGLLSRDVAKAEMDAMPQARKTASAAAESLSAEYKAAARQTLGHRAFLAFLQNQ